MPLPVTLSLIGLIVTFIVQTSVIAFWAGRISQRLTNVEKTYDDNAAMMKEVTRLTVEMEHVNNALGKVGREMEGVHRQLANIATNRIGVSGTLP